MDGTTYNRDSSSDLKQFIFGLSFVVVPMAMVVFGMALCESNFCRRIRRTYKIKKKTEVTSGLPRTNSLCNICLTKYEEDQVIRILPCEHEFHKSCVDRWLKDYQKYCPLCRVEVIK